LAFEPKKISQKILKQPYFGKVFLKSLQKLKGDQLLKKSSIFKSYCFAFMVKIEVGPIFGLKSLQMALKTMKNRITGHGQLKTIVFKMCVSLFFRLLHKETCKTAQNRAL
jgi:hypothetical protein